MIIIESSASSLEFITMIIHSFIKPIINFIIYSYKYDFTTLKLISAVNSSEFAMRSAIERARSIVQS